MKIRYRKSPLVDQEIKELMQKRDQTHKIARQTGAKIDWKTFKSLREEVYEKLQEAERAYVRNEIQNNKSNNAMWNVISSCIPRKVTTRPVYNKNNKQLSNDFNEFFTSVGQRAAEVQPTSKRTSNTSDHLHN